MLGSKLHLVTDRLFLYFSKKGLEGWGGKVGEALTAPGGEHHEKSSFEPKEAFFPIHLRLPYRGGICFSHISVPC